MPAPSFGDAPPTPIAREHGPWKQPHPSDPTDPTDPTDRSNLPARLVRPLLTLSHATAHHLSVMHDVKWRILRPGPCIPPLLSLLFWCSCATTPPQTSSASAPAFPAETTFNPGAGRGDPLHITLHLETGEKIALLCGHRV